MSVYFSTSVIFPVERKVLCKLHGCSWIFSKEYKRKEKKESQTSMTTQTSDGEEEEEEEEEGIRVKYSCLPVITWSHDTLSSIAFYEVKDSHVFLLSLVRKYLCNHHFSSHFPKERNGLYLFMHHDFLLEREREVIGGKRIVLLLENRGHQKDILHLSSERRSSPFFKFVSGVTHIIILRKLWTRIRSYAPDTRYICRLTLWTSQP